MTRKKAVPPSAKTKVPAEAPAFTEADWWRAFPYKFISVRLPDGTSFYLASWDVVRMAAQFLSQPQPAGSVVPKLPPAEQLLAEVGRNPETLLSMVRQFSAETIFAAARGAYWHTPRFFAVRWWPHDAQVTLVAQEL